MGIGKIGRKTVRNAVKPRPKRCVSYRFKPGEKCPIPRQNLAQKAGSCGDFWPGAGVLVETQSVPNAEFR